MWDKLEVTYEGTEKVKETIISLLVYKYELFQMKEGETIESMFAQLSKIIGELKASGKTYPQIEHIRRVLRSLPSQWNAKVVALECMNLNTITYEEVRGDLIAFDKTHLNKWGQEDTKKKTVAFKAKPRGQRRRKKRGRWDCINHWISYGIIWKIQKQQKRKKLWMR